MELLLQRYMRVALETNMSVSKIIEGEFFAIRDGGVDGG
jgi:hypothetical protein